MKKVIMLGSGGFAREVLDTIDAINHHAREHIAPIGFVYDGGSKDAGRLIHNIPVLGELSYLKQVDLSEVHLVASVGRSVWRKKMVEEARTMGGKFINIIHPTVTLSKWAKLGEGVIIQRFSGINSDVVVGNFFVANAFASIGHDVVIGNYVHVNPYGSIAGGSKIGDDVFIGVKATVLTCTVGDGAVIGSCALVTKDVPPNTMAKGIPARFSPIEEKKY
ncbi:MAG: hypothetical protein GX155_07485 [Smithella sp.]|nr:hypothetical protein [Smithella sp.]